MTLAGSVILLVALCHLKNKIIQNLKYVHQEQLESDRVLLVDIEN
jgi:hypothetical protein